MKKMKINTIPNPNTSPNPNFNKLKAKNKNSEVRWQDLNPQQKGCQPRVAVKRFCPLGHKASRLV